MTISKRWIILIHFDAPDDLARLHFDLLLEDKTFCRTWRLSQIPVLDGPSVCAKPSAHHKLRWLDAINEPVSGNRGWAKRYKNGDYSGSLPISFEDPVKVFLSNGKFFGKLLIKDGLCNLYS